MVPALADVQDPPPVSTLAPNPEQQTFTQADVDRIVRERVKRERDKFADYDALREKAGQSTTLEERVAGLLTRSQAKQVNAVMLTCGTYDAAGDLVSATNAEGTTALPALTVTSSLVPGTAPPQTYGSCQSWSISSRRSSTRPVWSSSRARCAHARPSRRPATFA